MENIIITDKDGNTYTFKNGRVILHLKKLNKTSKIGKIYTTVKNGKDMVIYEKNEKEEDVFRIWDAWSIPVVIFEKVDGIHFISETIHYKITTAKANKIKDYLHFRTSGYEKKVYIPRKFWYQSEK